MKATWLAASLVLALAVSCSGPTATLSRYAPVTQLIPADTPFAIMGAASDESSPPAAQLSSELPALFRSHFQSLLGLDVFDVEQLAAVGLDANSEWALFGLELHPAFILRLADRDKFQRFVEQLKAPGHDLDITSHRVDGRAVESLVFGSSRLSVTIRGQHLLGVYHPAELDLTTLFLPLFGLQAEQSLLGSSSFAELSKTFGAEPEVFAFLRTGALQTQLAARQEGRLIERLRFLPEPKHQAFLQRERAFLKRCAGAGEKLGQSMPFVVASIKRSPEQTEHELLFSSSPELREDLARVLAPRPGRYEALRQDALLSFSLSVDFGALAALSGEDAELVLCPDLGALVGARALLSRHASNTRLDELFTGSIEAALYTFDLNLPLLSKRSGLLLLGSGSVQQVYEGLQEVFSRTLGDAGHRDDGSPQYSFMGIVLRFALVPLSEHVALLLGKLEQSKLEALLATPVSTPALSARLDIDGPRLFAAIDKALSDLPSSSVETELVAALAGMLEGLLDASWTVQLSPQGLSIRGLFRHQTSTPAPAQ